LSELEAVRLMLRGGSVIDWYRLNFKDEEEARRYIKVLGADLDQARDQARFAQLREGAEGYLRDEHNYRIPDELCSCPPLDLFLYASELKGRRRDRFFACLLLKVMHIVHHIQARELRYQLPLSASELGQLLIRKVDRFAAGLSEQGFPLVAYRGGEKEMSSTITKLLVKRAHHAAAVRDRVRFRFIVEKPADLLPLLVEMTRDCLPFNYIVPGQTVNQLLNFTALMESHAAYREKASDLQVHLGHEEHAGGGLNEFSGPTFRVINFVADVPIRVPESVLEADEGLASLGPIIFGLAEFQIVDAQTDEENESGDNSHERYKDRQKARVRERLERGLRGVDIDVPDA
jgi:uncharacterized protein (TIGR04552 family)